MQFLCIELHYIDICVPYMCRKSSLSNIICIDVQLHMFLLLLLDRHFKGRQPCFCSVARCFFPQFARDPGY